MLDSRAPTDRLATGRSKPRVFDPTVPPQALTIPRQHPRIYGIPVAILHLRSYRHELLTPFIHFALHAAYALGMPVSRTVSLPTQRSLYTVLRGPFAHKKSQENFEKVVHKRAIKVWDTDSEVLSKWIKYLEINMMPGIGIRVVNWERAEIGFGAKKLEEIQSAQKELLRKRKEFHGDSSSDRIKAIADQIIEAEMEAASAAEVAAASHHSGPSSWLEVELEDDVLSPTSGEQSSAIPSSINPSPPALTSSDPPPPDENTEASPSPITPKP